MLAWSCKMLQHGFTSVASLSTADRQIAEFSHSFSTEGRSSIELQGNARRRHHMIRREHTATSPCSGSVIIGNCMGDLVSCALAACTALQMWWYLHHLHARGCTRLHPAHQLRDEAVHKMHPAHTIPSQMYAALLTRSLWLQPTLMLFARLHRSTHVRTHVCTYMAVCTAAAARQLRPCAHLIQGAVLHAVS
jgi:hypothetical protein